MEGIEVMEGMEEIEGIDVLEDCGLSSRILGWYLVIANGLSMLYLMKRSVLICSNKACFAYSLKIYNF